MAADFSIPSCLILSRLWNESPKVCLRPSSPYQPILSLTLIFFMISTMEIMSRACSKHKASTRSSLTIMLQWQRNSCARKWAIPRQAIAALEAYQLAAGECSSIVAEQAFESGFQTAVQMLVAGLIPPENKFAAEVPLTTQELRKMDGEQVFCLDMNEEVRVVARKKGFIQVTNDKEIHLITGLTLYRHRPSWCQ